jgi:hypothetical protein
MSEKYTFKVSKYFTESSKDFCYKDYLYGNIVVLVKSNEFINNFYLTVRFDNEENIFISRDRNYTLDSERIGYSQGYFGFQTPDNARNAIHDLEIPLNSNIIAKNLCVKWNDFIIQLKEWFKDSLSPCLRDELENHKAIHKL